MIVHIAPDEKFIDIAFRTFAEVYPQRNKFFVVSRSAVLKYVKTPEIEKIRPDQIDQQLLNYCHSCEFVILHGLLDFSITIINKAVSGTKFLWIGWGADYYNRFRDGEDALLLPDTLKFLKRNRSFYQLLHRQWQLFKGLITSSRRQFRQALSRIDFFAPVLPDEYEICRQKLTNLHAKFISWNYGNLDDDYSVPGLEISGENILLGNSASPTNNHFEAINSLSRLVALEKRRNQSPVKIIAPLSYGDSVYRGAVISDAQKKLGISFEPLLDFMSAQDYWKAISSCRYVIMCHLRQQGMGNILTLLNLGASIFLHPCNPAYAYFKRNQAHVFSCEELFRSRSWRDFTLTPDQIAENRQFLRKNWSRDIILKKSKTLIDTVLSSPGHEGKD